MNMLLFKEDIDANKMSPFRRLYWTLLFMRLQQNCTRRSFKKFLGALKRLSLLGTLCELPAQAFIGGGVYIPHVNGIVISPDARIGSNPTILQQATVGIDEFKSTSTAPIIGDNVFIGAGAKIIGPIEIGDNVRIGASAVVTKNIPSNSTVVGANRII